MSTPLLRHFKRRQRHSRRSNYQVRYTRGQNKRPSSTQRPSIKSRRANNNRGTHRNQMKSTKRRNIRVLPRTKSRPRANIRTNSRRSNYWRRLPNPTRRNTNGNERSLNTNNTIQHNNANRHTRVTRRNMSSRRRPTHRRTHPSNILASDIFLNSTRNLSIRYRSDPRIRPHGNIRNLMTTRGTFGYKRANVNNNDKTMLYDREIRRATHRRSRSRHSRNQTRSTTRPINRLFQVRHRRRHHYGRGSKMTRLRTTPTTRRERRRLRQNTNHTKSNRT